MLYRHPLIENEAFALPFACRFRHIFQIPQDATLKMIDVFNALSLQECGGFFAANAASAEHCEFCAVCGQFAAVLAEPLGKIPESLGLRINRPFKCPDCHLIIVTRIDQDSTGVGYQGVPVFCCHISANLALGVDAIDAQRYDFFLHPHFHAVKRHFDSVRIFDVEFVAVGQGAQMCNYGVNARSRSGNSAIHTLGRH